MVCQEHRPLRVRQMKLTLELTDPAGACRCAQLGCCLVTFFEALSGLLSRQARQTQTTRHANAPSRVSPIMKRRTWSRQRVSAMRS